MIGRPNFERIQRRGHKRPVADRRDEFDQPAEAKARFQAIEQLLWHAVRLDDAYRQLVDVAIVRREWLMA